MTSILAKYWRPLAIIIIVAAGALWVANKVSSYGEQQYNAGYAKAVAEQKAADKKEEQRRNAELQKIQADAQQRIDAARNDAVNAAAKSGRLRAETERIRKLAERYTGTQPASVSTRKVIVMLTQLLDESNDAYRRTAEEADRYYNAGLTCQKQYESLIK
ncbi:Rz-like spanin [Salmonella phage LPSTLL]|uniref:Tail protein n=1 Tax=Salmonella phage LPSTLL TaxID=3071280 RepID=A0A8E3UYI0_9CAUD|nr:Rz-like spanin [Salmonella phage LPSTLL]QGZ15000.1 tail protein [Salmonella phage LPSTLL]